MIPEKLIEAVKKRKENFKDDKAALISIRKKEAWKEVYRLKEEFLKEDPQIKRLVLFGSLAKDNIRSLNFDIDLSFEGVEYYRCVSIALNSKFKVDLVDYRSARSFIREEIDTRGKVIYAADT